MCDGKHRALVVMQEVLEPQDRLGVQVVRGLVEQQYVAALLEGHGQVEPVAFAAGEYAHLFFLVGPRDGEAGHIGAGIHAPVAELDDVAVVRNGFIYRLFGGYRGVLLVHIGEFDGLTHPELA